MHRQKIAYALIAIGIIMIVVAMLTPGPIIGIGAAQLALPAVLVGGLLVVIGLMYRITITVGRKKKRAE